MQRIRSKAESHQSIVPKFIQQAASGEPFSIHGDGSQLRSFLHVSDICAAILVVLTKGEIGEVYNVGTTAEVSVRDLAQNIRATVDAVKGRKTGTFEVSHVDAIKTGHTTINDTTWM